MGQIAFMCSVGSKCDQTHCNNKQNIITQVIEIIGLTQKKCEKNGNEGIELCIGHQVNPSYYNYH